MAMSVGSEKDDEIMNEINTTPLVDVMLVLLIIFLIAVPVAIQTIQKLKLPVMPSQESKDKVENLLLTVSTTDSAGRSAGEPGFEGANLGGECRIYFNNITPVDSVELRDQAFNLPARLAPQCAVLTDALQIEQLLEQHAAEARIEQHGAGVDGVGGFIARGVHRLDGKCPGAGRKSIELVGAAGQQSRVQRRHAGPGAGCAGDVHGPRDIDRFRHRPHVQNDESRV